MKGLEGSRVPCDSVTKVFHEADIRECSPWPSALVLVGEALLQETKQPYPSTASPQRVCVFVCVFTHLRLCSNTLGRGQGTTL